VAQSSQRPRDRHEEQVMSRASRTDPPGHVPAVQQAKHPVPLVDAEAAGGLLGVPKSWVLAEARADRIPHVRLGRYVRFDADELAAWWQSRRRGPWRTGSDPVPRDGETA
jgi:excisionase family DNA binding protein